MEFKTVLSKFIYRIEPKPGGGFIAVCKDPGVPAIEGATRNEVQQNIQATISTSLAKQFPALKSALESNDVKLHYHVEAKPGGGFIIHHGDAQTGSAAHEPMEGSTREHIENLIESKLLSALIDRLPPELHQQITDKLNSGGLDIDVNRKITVTTKGGDALTSVFDIARENNSSLPEMANAGSHPMEILSASSPDLELAAKSGSDSTQPPITRYEKSSSGGSVFRFLLALAIVALLMYLYLHRH
jgi:hypothetical protein